jgi:hypothetical protein
MGRQHGADTDHTAQTTLRPSVRVTSVLNTNEIA